MQRKRSLLYPVGTVPSENDYCYIHWVQYLAITVTTSNLAAIENCDCYMHRVRYLAKWLLLYLEGTVPSDNCHFCIQRVQYLAITANTISRG